MPALMRVVMWRLLLALASALALVVVWPFRAFALVVQHVHAWQDAAEIEWLLAVAWRRTLAERAERADRCPVQGVCLGRADCRDHACPGRGRRA